MNTIKLEISNGKMILNDSLIETHKKDLQTSLKVQYDIFIPLHTILTSFIYCSIAVIMSKAKQRGAYNCSLV